MTYLLDANVFIQSNRAHYGLDFVPGFWDWLDNSFAAGILHSIQPIGKEINSGQDALKTWAADRKDLFVPMDAACGPSLTALSTWATGHHFTPAAITEFLNGADYQLIAYAHAHDLTVVTMETSEPQRKSKVKIPDACLALDVTWITPFQMLRAEAASFVLGS